MEQNHQSGPEDAQQPVPTQTWETTAFDDWGLTADQQPSLQVPANTPEVQPVDLSWVPTQQPDVQPTAQTPRSPDSDGGNSWDRARRRYERGLEVQTALLSNRLTEQIRNDNWSGAIVTLKRILDLDPARRHPPLYGWATSWDAPYKRSRQEFEGDE